MKKSGLFKVVTMACALSAFPIIANAEETATQQRPTPEQIANETVRNSQFLAANVLQKAKSLLEYYGDFAPFGAALLPGGEVKYVWAIKPGESAEGINAPLVMNAVRTALSGQAANGRILGSAVVYQFQPEATEENPDPERQINIELEYISGMAQVLATHYHKSDEGYEYSEGATRKFNPIVFAPQAPTQTAEGASEGE